MKRRADRLYGLILYLLPRDLREEFGADMEQLYADRLGEADGRLGRLTVRLDSARDVVWQALLERGERTHHGMRRLTTEGMGMDGWIQDVRFGARTLTRHPGFSIAAIVTLALGIGANVAMFSVVKSVLLRPLPYPDSENLVVLWSVDRVSGERGNVDHPDVRELQAGVPGLSLAGHSGTRPTLTGFGDPQVIFGAEVTDGLVTLMGRTPALGRDLRADDDTPGGARVVVVSHDFWTGRLGSDPRAVGRTITLSGSEWEIVGVAPTGFDYPNGTELWMPRRHEIDGCGHGCRVMAAVGRIEPGADAGVLETRLDAVAAQMAEANPNSHRDVSFALQPMLDNVVSDVRQALWVLLGSVAAVLLIACANVANLMLVRASGRRAEVGLRATLGASRVRIIRQLLTESVMLATAAGALGTALAYWGVTVLVAVAPDGLPRMGDVTIDPTVLGFAGVLVLVVTALFGALPALHVSGGVQDAGSGDRVAGARRGETSRSALLVGEVALSLTLLLGTGLLLRTLGEIRAVDLGFDTEGVERFRISVPESRYDSLRAGTFLLEMEDALTALPGVEVAGWSFGVPLASGNIVTSVSFGDRPELPPADRPVIDIRPATPGFLTAAGLQLVRGRWIEAEDRYGAPPVAVINEAAVRTFFPGSDPIGVELSVDVSWGFENTPPLTIVGVVGDAIRWSPTETPAPAVYLSNPQFGANTGYVSLRLRPGVTTAIAEARRVVADMDPSLAIWDVANMADVVTEARAGTRFYATLLTVFSLVALVLSAVGLYGVVAYSVSRRTREIGIRIALGAASDEVTGMVLREGIRPVVLGIALGLVTSWFATRALSSMLFGVTPQDPATVVAVTLLLMLVAMTATAIPARRASLVAPSSALRAD